MKVFKFLVFVALTLASLPAIASFHLMKIVEVFPGTAASPNAQYVVLQMYAAGQTFVGGHSIILYNAAGNQIDSVAFIGAVTTGSNQSKILISTSAAQTFFGVTPDLIWAGDIPRAGGKVCFDTIDCFAWGNYTGTPVGVGTPFNAAVGLQSGKAAIRRLDVSGSPTVLEGTDDTDDSANDFVSGLPAPRNNPGQSGTIPPNTCPNSIIEGLEECDDGNVVNGDGCSSTCMLEPDLVFANGFE